VGKHVMCAAKVNGKLVMRAYTPISTNDELGVFRLLIKTYFKVRTRSELLLSSESTDGDINRR
jgi:hypothetical protein